jgi:type III pantothenate kinase
MRAELGQNVPVVATGGLAPMFAGATDHITHIDRDLIMRGLVTLYQHNRLES